MKRLGEPGVTAFNEKRTPDFTPYRAAVSR
jgi:hypothetical protein